MKPGGLETTSSSCRSSFWRRCYSASSERKLLLHKLMCVVLSAVVIALCRAIRVVCLHDVSMIVIGVEGADQGEEEPSHHHVAPEISLPHEQLQVIYPSCSKSPHFLRGGSREQLLITYISTLFGSTASLNSFTNSRTLTLVPSFLSLSSLPRAEKLWHLFYCV
jgi:hypothetical protein